MNRKHLARADRKSTGRIKRLALLFCVTHLTLWRVAVAQDAPTSHFVPTAGAASPERLSGGASDPEPAAAPPALPQTRFVPDGARLINATIELRTEATIYEEEIHLKQIARWSDADAPSLEPLGAMVLGRLTDRKPYRSFTVQQVKDILHEAGVNEAMIRFTGPTACTVSRADVKFDEDDALQQWITAREPGADAPPIRTSEPDATLVDSALPPLRLAERAAAPVPTTTKAPTSMPGAAAARTLRSILVDDVGTRLGFSTSDLQVTFDPSDEKVLNLPEPQFRFNVAPKRVRSLGTVTWDVAIVTDAGQHKTSITAVARAWQDQVIVARPISIKQVIREADVETRRVLTDEPQNDKVLALKQVIGQQAGRDLRAGVVVTARLVEAVPLVKPGQLVTVTLGQGGIRVKTVARATESGTYGQTIKVKNETTRDIYDVTVTGPQAAVVGNAPDTDVAATE